MDRDQAPRIMGPKLRAIMFETQHHFCFDYAALDALNYENIELISSLQIVQELLEGIVHVRHSFYTLGLALDVRTTPSSKVTYTENGNITIKCIDNGVIACSDETASSTCLSRLIENEPGCSEYNYYTVGNVEQNCSTTQTSCALSTTISRATRSRHDTTWECSSSKYSVDSISPSSGISVTGKYIHVVFYLLNQT